jgi:hypothetical protein
MTATTHREALAAALCTLISHPLPSIQYLANIEALWQFV